MRANVSGYGILEWMPMAPCSSCPDDPRREAINSAVFKEGRDVVRLVRGVTPV